MPQRAGLRDGQCLSANDTCPVNAREESAAPLALDTDYGPVGRGASNPRYVLASDENEYIIKGPSLSSDNPRVGANELIAARLASKLGLPVLRYALLSWRGGLFFASQWMDKSKFSPALDRELFLKCENRDLIYEAVIFDAWLINKDRHNENLIARRISRTGPPRHNLLLNDHSHLLVSPSGPTDISQLMAQVDRPASNFVVLDFVRESIVDPARVREALSTVERLSDEEIESVVASTPDGLLASDERGIYSEFLVKRRSRLRAVMQKESGAFPNLKGAI
jgi:hypothetical protein